MQQCWDCNKVYDESEYADCPYCEDGVEVDEFDENEPQTCTCAECDGTGRIECYKCEGESGDDSDVCSACNGDGGEECPDCGGSGEVTIHMGKII
jgi:hypothetical protein